MILLVEDEVLIALSEKKQLESYGYEVMLAHSGEAAVKSAGAVTEIDLILMDIDLGKGMDGTQAAANILKIRDIPIVFLSSHMERETVEKTEKITSYGYVLKNSSITVLDASIKMAFKLFEAFKKEREKEEVLKKNERLFSAIFDANPMSMQILDKNGCTLKTNPAFISLFGSAPPAGYSLFEDKQLSQPGTKEIVELLRKGEHIRFPEVFFNAHDSLPELPDIPVVVRTTGYPLHGSKGNPEEYVLMHENITAQRQVEEKNEKHLFEMHFLSRSALECINLSPDADIYGFFAKKLSLLLPGYKIILSEFSEEENLATVKAVEVGDDLLSTVVKILGRNLIGMKSPIPPNGRQELMGTGIVTGPKGTFDIAGGSIPKAVCSMLDKVLHIGTIYGMGISTENQLYGNVVMISPQGTVLEDSSMLESFIRQTSVAIQKRLADDRIKTLLNEKTTLLLEVQHRIKNNIASIEGLLTLQLNSLANPEAESALKDAIGRVGSIRILYEKLLLNDDYRETSVKDYLESLIDSVLVLYPGKSGIACERKIEDFTLSLRNLSALGIVVNEILTNTMKHAFSDRGSGVITISLKRTKDRVKLTIQDNGRGLPEEFDLQKSKGFGHMLIGMLSEQLNGTFTMSSGRGTKSILEFDV